MMRKAGCIGIEIGLESCDPHVLKRMNKNQTCSDALIIDKTLKRNGIIPLYLMISFFPGETLNTSFLNASFLNKVHDKNTRIVDYLKAVHLPYSFGQFATPYKGTSFENIAEKEGIIFDTGYNRQKVSFIPNSLLDDIPIKTREIDKNDFCSIIDKFKGEILYYLGDSSILGFREYNKYKEFIYSLYSKVDGSHPVKDIVKEQDVRHGCLALKFLAMFGMINSKNR
jgi:radical SAM superfamily enzyme YgiQ (UPF0313 family)